MKEAFLIVGFLEITLIIFMQWQLYLKKMLTTFSVSSYAISIFLFVDGIVLNNINLLILATLTAVIRGFYIPHFIKNRLKKEYYLEREIKSIVPTALSIILSLVFVVAGYIIYHATIYKSLNLLGGSIPIALLFQGIFLIISRNNAFVQLIGYMVAENSIYLLGGYLFPELPFIIEGGILLDLIGIVMISGIVMRLREEDVSNIIDEFEEFKG
jgi:hydrogenase-4 component E